MKLPIYIIVVRSKVLQDDWLPIKTTTNEVFHTLEYFNAITEKRKREELFEESEYKILRCTEILGV